MKRAIVMGASSGMGREVSKLLLADGWHLGIAARRVERLRELEREFPGHIVVQQIDVTDARASQQLLELIDLVGGVDLYFHASGIGKQNMNLLEDIENQTVQTNGMGFARMIGTVYRYMAAHQGGHIAVISSIAGTKGLGAAPSYSATKAFQNTYIQALEQQANMRGLNISFTDIRPGFVDTPLLGDEKHYPMLLKPERVAEDIVKAIRRKKHVLVIDWRYRILTFFWRLIPNALWRRLRVRN
ncbi:MAG: SDR family NAD(P)-dependent oxidoreductase [Prevotella sp.]|nr:SDR family NAD(P)-dependent oxidoreductase [Prevotella sp.]